jgi:hypothetical protein
MKVLAICVSLIASLFGILYLFSEYVAPLPGFDIFFLPYGVIAGLLAIPVTVTSVQPLKGFGYLGFLTCTLFAAFHFIVLIISNGES